MSDTAVGSADSSPGDGTSREDARDWQRRGPGNPVVART
jgi:hypothetical protein